MTENNYGCIINSDTGAIVRVANREDWLRAFEFGDPETGHHKDADGTTTVWCDGRPPGCGQIHRVDDGAFIRRATLRDWRYAQKWGVDDGTFSVFTDPDSGERVFCNGPEDEDRLDPI